MLVIPSASEGPRRCSWTGQARLCERRPFERSLAVYTARDDPRGNRKIAIACEPSSRAEAEGSGCIYLEGSHDRERSELYGGRVACRSDKMATRNSRPTIA